MQVVRNWDVFFSQNKILPKISGKAMLKSIETVYLSIFLCRYIFLGVTYKIVYTGS